jgi:hypothetical protein
MPIQVSDIKPGLKYELLNGLKVIVTEVSGEGRSRKVKFRYTPPQRGIPLYQVEPIKKFAAECVAPPPKMPPPWAPPPRPVKSKP